MPKRYENVLLDQYRVMDGIARRYLLSLEESQNPLLSSAHDELYVAMVFEYVKLFQETYNITEGDIMYIPDGARVCIW